MAVEAKLTTIEQFWEFSQLPQNATRHLELIEGVIEEMPPSSFLNSMIAAMLVRLLSNFVYERHLGYVTGADGGYILGPHDVAIPDAAFISKARVPDPSVKLIDGGPDLAVEVISPSETPRMVLDKAHRYMKAGTLIIWAVYAEDRVIDVYRPGAQNELRVQTLTIEDQLDGGDVLPGFMLPLRQLFAEAEQPDPPQS